MHFAAQSPVDDGGNVSDADAPGSRGALKAIASESKYGHGGKRACFRLDMQRASTHIKSATIPGTLRCGRQSGSASVALAVAIFEVTEDGQPCWLWLNSLGDGAASRRDILGSAIQWPCRMQVLQAGAHKLIYLELQPDMVASIARQTGFGARAKGTPRVSHRARGHVEGRAGLVMQTPIPLAKKHDRGGKVQRTGASTVVTYTYDAAGNRTAVVAQ